MFLVSLPYIVLCKKIQSYNKLFGLSLCYIPNFDLLPCSGQKVCVRVVVWLGGLKPILVFSLDLAEQIHYVALN